MMSREDLVKCLENHRTEWKKQGVDCRQLEYNIMDIDAWWDHNMEKVKQALAEINEWTDSNGENLKDYEKFKEYLNIVQAELSKVKKSEAAISVENIC